MAKKNGKSDKSGKSKSVGIPPETKRAILVVVFGILGLILLLAGFGIAGPAGADTYALFNDLLGVGYFLLPALLFILAGTTLQEETPGISAFKGVTSLIFVISGLGYVGLVFGRGGLVGDAIAKPIVHLFDIYAALVLLGGLTLISFLVLVEGKISVELFALIGRAIAAPFKAAYSVLKQEPVAGVEPTLTGLPITPATKEVPKNTSADDEDEDTEDEESAEPARGSETVRPVATSNTKELQAKNSADALKAMLGQYTPPPLSLLERDKGRPGVGDIKGNANIIKRTLANFGIVVELDEISIGPSVTRYAIKPAEGVRLQKIVGLQTNLELALAAHPVRIEAPIPGKSLVGIEVPNSAKVTVGLGTLLEAPEFANSPKPLLVALGRDIAGGSQFGNVAKMPHILIAGATGSGKSVTIHAIINSLLYRCGPQQLRFMMIDPKRVELTLYNRIPHLLTPVITDPKKAILSLRWAVKEMERRYNILETERVRDIESYHQNILTPALAKLREQGAPDEDEVVPEGMPYIIIVIDELADIMQTFPRELEAAIVRLAQMSRAVGIHLMLSTQRPSVNVITGLIKANVPSRLALQVASQIDSRTILDQGGAEKLLGAGDMLYLGAEMGKPVRLQSAFIGENEVKKVTDFITKNNEAQIPIDMGAALATGPLTPLPSSGGGFGDEEEGDDTEMYEAARAEVIASQKASTSYLQRKLKVGYARAARLMDMLEERGVIGPGDGAKPREVLEKGSSTSLGASGAEDEI